MVSMIAKCFSWSGNSERREIKLLMLGLDNAGKSTIINDLKGEPKEMTIPTVGFSSAVLNMLNFKITAYDVGGGPRIRGIWKDYYAEIFGMVYVIDASDQEKIAESRTVLREALSDSRLAGKPFVLFANKQDKEGALSENDIELQFELEQLEKKCESPYKVFQCTAFMNNGKKIDRQLKKGLTWLLQTMEDDFSSLSDRVQKEIEIQKAADKKERAERLERVKKVREERERAERETEANAKAENAQSEDDDDVVFGNAMPRVLKDVTKTKKKKKKKKKLVLDEQSDNETCEKQETSKLDDTRHKESDKEGLDIHHQSNGVVTENKKKKKKQKSKTKRNKTAPAPDGDDSDTGVVLKPISAWRTPPASLNGFPGNGRKLEPIRPPLHNSLYLSSRTSPITEEEDEGKLSNGYMHSRPRPNGEDSEVIT